jgi:hypothetical protein
MVKHTVISDTHKPKLYTVFWRPRSVLDGLIQKTFTYMQQNPKFGFLRVRWKDSNFVSFLIFNAWLK